jgi:hypothetical protein
MLIARIDADLEFSFVFGLKKANDPIVLELFSDGSYEDRTQIGPSDVCFQQNWAKPRAKPGEYSTSSPTRRKLGPSPTFFAALTIDRSGSTMSRAVPP